MRVILTTLCLSSVCMTVLGLWCFGCQRTRNMAECAVGENLSFIECEEDETVCLKENYFRYDDVGYFGGRICGQEVNMGYGNTCEELIANAMKRKFIDHQCHSCKGNYCNKANEARFDNRIIVAFVIIIAIFSFS